MVQEKVSIIVPVYMVENYIDRCVESLIHQTYQNLEILLVDDGSKDSSGAICDSWALKDDRIKVIHQSNGGLSVARNTGIEASTGEYLCFVDSDDEVELDFVDYLVGLFDSNHDISITVCGMNRSDCVNKQASKKRITVMPGEALAIFLTEYTYFGVYACNKMYRKHLYKSIRYPVGELYEDSAVIHKLLIESKMVSIGYKLKYRYLVNREGSIISTYNPKGSFDKKRHLDDLEATIAESFPVAINAFDVFAVRSYCDMLMMLSRATVERDTRRKLTRTYKEWMSPYLNRALMHKNDISIAEIIKWIGWRYMNTRMNGYLRSILHKL